MNGYFLHDLARQRQLDIQRDADRSVRFAEARRARERGPRVATSAAVQRFSSVVLTAFTVFVR